MSDENLVDREIKRLGEWLAKTGMAESRLGMLSCANQRAVERVRNKTASLETFEAVMGYIARHPHTERMVRRFGKSGRTK